MIHLLKPLGYAHYASDLDYHSPNITVPPETFAPMDFQVRCGPNFNSYVSRREFVPSQPCVQKPLVPCKFPPQSVPDNEAGDSFPSRFGPRHIRAESSMVRIHNPSTGAAPFHSLMVADIGDVNVNLYNLQDSCRQIREAYQKIMAAGCIPLTLGKEPGAGLVSCFAVKTLVIKWVSGRPAGSSKAISLSLTHILQWI